MRVALRIRELELTMLSRFHAINKVKAQPTLPQSESVLNPDEFVHFGYTIALDPIVRSGMQLAREGHSLVMHVLIPTLSAET